MLFRSFAAKVDYPTGLAPDSVTAADLDGDGKPDLAVANGGAPPANTVSVLLNQGNGTFAARVDYAVGTTPDSVAAADLDGDGKLDLAVVQNYSNTVSVLLNNGNGTFAAKVDYPTGTAPGSVAAVDLNGDGMADLAISNELSNTVSVLLNLCVP